MPQCLTTDEIAPRDRFGFWREAVCNCYVQLDCQSPSPERFQGEILLYRMSNISASFVGGSEQHVRRRKRDIGRANDASFLISLQIRHDGLVEQAGRSAHLQEGDFALYSSVDPYALNIPDGFRQLVIQVPRENMLDRLPNADLLTARAVRGDTDIGGLVKDSILRLVKAIDHSSDITRACMQETIVDLLATGLATLEDAQLHLTAPERQQVLRARTFISQNLKNPDLNRTALAAHLGISVRRLGEIFQAEGKPVAATIREMRLHKIATDLADSRNKSQSISAIAIKWGINNMQHFPRMFREHYGTSPSEFQRRSTSTDFH